VRRGLGRVQQTCLQVISQREAKAKDFWPTTYDIAADIYQIEPDKDGNRWVTDAQHVAVKRALESLQRQGHLIGFRDLLQARIPGIHGRSELAHIWMTEKGLLRWLQFQDKTAKTTVNPAFRVVVIQKARDIAKRAKGLGMTVPSAMPAQK
jgi:DNA topoisomerase IA